MWYLLFHFILVNQLGYTPALGETNIDEHMLTETDSNIKETYEKRNLSRYYKNNSNILMAICENESGQIYRICGGSLIDDVWLLTSQTCRRKKRLDLLLIAVFESIFDRQIESSLSERFLEKWITHPNYDFSSGIVMNDIALLRLEDIYYHIQRRKLVELSTRKLFEESGIGNNSTKQRCVFLFWPLETFDWHKHLRFIYLRHASVEIIPRSVCRAEVVNAVISEEQFCGKFSPGEPIPDKISPGPLLCFDVQFGIYTMKAYDRSGKMILIFTRLDPFQEYIEGITHTHAFTNTFPKSEARVIQESIDDLDFNKAIIVYPILRVKFFLAFIIVYITMIMN